MSYFAKFIQVKENIDLLGPYLQMNKNFKLQILQPFIMHILEAFMFISLVLMQCNIQRSSYKNYFAMISIAG